MEKNYNVRHGYESVGDKSLNMEISQESRKNRIHTACA